MIKKNVALVAVGMIVIFLTGCSFKNDITVSHTSSSTEKKKQSNQEVVDIFLETLEKEKLIESVTHNIKTTEDMLNKDIYDTASQIIEFDIEVETGIPENPGTPPPNQMRKGRIVFFDNEETRNHFVDTLTDTDKILFDVVGVDTNEIYPIYISSKTRPVVLVLNQYIPQKKVETFEEMFLNTVD